MNNNTAGLPAYYSGSCLSEVQKPHPQPPPRKRGGDYDVPCMIRKRHREVGNISYIYLRYEEWTILHSI